MKAKRIRKKLILTLLVAISLLLIELGVIATMEIKATYQKQYENEPFVVHAATVSQKSTEPTGFSQQDLVDYKEEKMKPILQVKDTDAMPHFYSEVEQTRVPEENAEVIAHDEEFQDMCRLNHAESCGESLEGQISVAAVLLNREESEFFPNTFYEIMNEPGQFSPVWSGEVHVRKGNQYVVLKYEDVTEQTIEAVERALRGEDPTEQLLWDEAVRLGLDPEKYAEGGALFFYNPAGCSQDQLANMAYIRVKVQIGNHIFFKVWG